MAKRPAPVDEPDPTKAVRDEFCPGGRRRGVLVRVRADFSRSGKLLRYSLVLIDHRNHAADNGRVLGYDNAHGYHHRHTAGKVESVEFISYEDTLRQFEAEIWKYLAQG
jgi:hypothetical protein